MSLRVVPTGYPNTTTSGFCPWCHEFMKREPSEEDGCFVQSPKAMKMAAKQGCFICGWLVLLGGTEKMHRLYLKIPTSQTQALLTISISKANRIFDSGIGPAHTYFNVIDDTDCAEASRPYSPPDSLHIESVYFRNLATKWLQTCQNHHQDCRRGMAENNSFLPTRLIKIIDGSNVQLICSSDLRGTVEYVALSHRWGSSQPIKLLNQNLGQLQTSFAVKSLPKMYKKAITICTLLQFQYIWIDSLCIIQDSQEDWQKEAAAMHLMYGNSALNLCMPGAATTRKANLIKPLELMLERESEPPRRARMLCATTLDRDLYFNPLRERGWVFQESFLSRRSLVLGCKQVWWHCHEQIACETFPEGTNYGAIFGPGATSEDILRGMKLGNFEANKHKSSNPGSFYRRWWTMVDQYACTSLTYETDRVLAFSGVAQAFRRFHNIGSQYLAGIWSCNLPEGLLWCRQPNGGAGFRSKSYKAPSWSWMSIDGPYALWREVEHATESYCSIEQIYLPLVDKSNDTGLLNGGALGIRGHLIGPLPDDTSLETLDEAILRCHVRTEEEADSGICMVNEDEEEQDGVAFISYLDGLDPESSRVGSTLGAFRQTLAFEDAKGSIFCLPIACLCKETEGPYGSELELAGLILYSPSHQPGIFHRIGYYEVDCETSLDFGQILQEQYPIQSILLL